MKTSQSVSADKISFKYSGADVPLFEDFSFSVEKNSLLSIMGSSGTGKSTLGKLLCGTLTPSAGVISRGQEQKNNFDHVYLDQHSLNTVFPWQTVEQNLVYPLKKLGWPSEKIYRRVEETLTTFQISTIRSKYPSFLSGGELQRVALARVMTWKPKLLIIDEGISNIDKGLRLKILEVLRSAVDHENVTVILISHSLSDVYEISDRILILSGSPVNFLYDTKNSSDRKFNKAELANILSFGASSHD